MAMNGLAKLADCLESGANAIELDAAIIERARLPIQRLLDFAAMKSKPALVAGDA
jgi:quinolinate synthase